MTPLIESRQSPWFEGGFRPSGTYGSIDYTTLPSPTLRTAGSWIEGDQWQGAAETIRIPVSGDSIRIYVAGYPRHPGCKLWVEFYGGEDERIRSDCDIGNPTERWMAWDIQVPPGATGFRVFAVDHASDLTGWLAFSEPIEAPSPIGPAAFMAIQIFSTVALTLTILWVPGLCWCPPHLPYEWKAVITCGAGALLLPGIGVVLWLLAGLANPRILAVAMVGILWVALGARLWRRPPRVEPRLQAIFAVAGLVIIAAISKSSHSGGPRGEVFQGTISRTLAVGDRVDARVAFHVAQIAAQGFGPASPEADKYFSPWSFFSRGPMAGLAAVPISLATAELPPKDMPDQAWTPFDMTGYASYRITLVALAGLLIPVFYLTIAPVTGEKWAAIGAGLLALSPFGMHEVMFTWPKFEATACILLSFLFSHRARPLAAGITLGVGFLFHPMAALWGIWIMLWAMGRAAGGAGPTLLVSARFCLGAGLIAIPWMLAGKFAPHLPEAIYAGQGNFIRYFFLADSVPATWSSWLQTRWTNFSGTFIPFWLHAFVDHITLGSAYGPIDPAERFAFLWWNTLPFGMGLLLWASSVVVLAKNVRGHIPASVLLLFGPALFLVIYWGWRPTGLMRECGHPLLVATIAITCFHLSKSDGAIARMISSRAFPWLQLPETLLMLWMTTLLNTSRQSSFNELDWFYFTVCVAALGFAAWIVSRKTTERFGT